MPPKSAYHHAELFTDFSPILEPYRADHPYIGNVSYDATASFNLIYHLLADTEKTFGNYFQLKCACVQFSSLCSYPFKLIKTVL